MKLLVFAHTPPPLHGQSYMVQLLIDGLGGDRRQAGSSAPQPSISGIECYHVDCRYSDALSDIGSFRWRRCGSSFATASRPSGAASAMECAPFYFVPAPGKRAALYRDWVVMLLCRPFFRAIVHHWHAAGLGDWLRREGTWFERWLTHRLLGHPALGVGLAIPSMRDALWFRSQDVQIVPNGIHDPCPDFESAILPRRRARLQARRQLLQDAGLASAEKSSALQDAATYEILYLAHCMREKGVFDALDAVALANAQLRETRSPIICRLTVAGLFPNPEEEAEFRERIARPDLAGAVDYVGFVEGERKHAVLAASDCLCFPTYYHAETFGLVAVEAMAAGAYVVTTRWRALPDLLPPDHAGFVPPRDPAAIARVLISSFTQDGTILREVFVSQFTEQAHLEALGRVLRTLPV